MNNLNTTPWYVWVVLLVICMLIHSWAERRREKRYAVWFERIKFVPVNHSYSFIERFTDVFGVLSVYRLLEFANII